MAVTIDPRTSVFGDRMVVTGTYEAADATIDLSDFLSEINFADITPTSAMAPLNLEIGGAADASDATPSTFRNFATVDGTTITINKVQATQTAIGGTFIAIGRRA
tara:strand:- start:1491 stop:1805 length:315 start_codon:yes stop_codon:yes gene_type:complete